MKAALVLLLAIFTAPLAGAESIATGGTFDGIARIFTSCENCKTMEKLRTEVFAPAHTNARMHDRAKKAVGKVIEDAHRITTVAENDKKQFRGAHYANEIESFFILAVDAMPYAEDFELAENIAYINNELGSRSILEKVVKEMPAGCRKDFVVKSIVYKECEIDNDNAADAAQTAGKPVPKKLVCKPPTDNVQKCEAKAIARVK